VLEVAVSAVSDASVVVENQSSNLLPDLLESSIP
jgi:hypothetical protein